MMMPLPSKQSSYEVFPNRAAFSAFVEISFQKRRKMQCDNSSGISDPGTPKTDRLAKILGRS
jgi:hypothetical protein